MELLNTLSNLKFKSFHLVIMFLITMTVPGILILFYFYRDFFNVYDLSRLVMLQIGISTALLVSSYILSSLIILIIEMNIENEIFDNENESMEGIFQMSSMISLFLLFLILLIYYLIGSKNFYSFIICFICSEIFYGIIATISLIYFIKEKIKQEIAKNEIINNKTDDTQTQRNIILNEIRKYDRLLVKAEINRDKIYQFQLLRTPDEKEKQLLNAKKRIESIKNKIQQLGNELK